MNTPMDVQDTAVTPGGSRLGVGARLLAAAALVAMMVVGIVALGRVASDDVTAMALTTVFFVALAVALGWLVRRRRELLVPLGATYVAVAGAAGVLLGLPLVTDDVVEEDVIRVETTGMPRDGGAGADVDAMGADPAGPTAIASGRFESRMHPGEGTATLVRTTEGSTVLTLTDFATDNGPDLLVYLVPADAPADSIEGFIDLGPLRGNVGDQQYQVPSDVDAGPGWRVVIWCRAFAVNFTEATLA